MQISDELNTIVAYAREEAMRTGSYAITPDHLFLGILRHSANEACEIIVSCGADLSVLKKSIDACVFHERSIPYNEEARVTLNRDSSNALSRAVFEATREKASSTGSRHLLKALCQTAEYRCKHVLAEVGINYETIKESPKVEANQEKPGTTRVLGTFSIKAPEIYS